MYRVLTCVVDEHAPAILAVAALICLAANAVALLLLRRSAVSVRRRGLWLAAAGATAGIGIWSTHFVAMLAYDPGFAIAYEVGWTVASLAGAVGLAVPSFAVARLGGPPSLTAAAAGTLFGASIAAAHNLGMLGIVFPGSFAWNLDAVVATDVLGCVLSGAAFAALRRGPGGQGPALAVALLFTAIFVLHFVGIGTAVAVLDPLADTPSWPVPRAILALSIIGMVGAILVLGAVALRLDARTGRAESDAARMRQLADAALEGIAILRGETIVDANRSFATLVGLPSAALAGRRFGEFLADGDRALATSPSTTDMLRADLKRQDGSPLPVEMHVESVAFPDGPRRIVAVRDLRERAAAESHIRYLAHHDLLTGLLNRASLNVRLSAEIEAARLGGSRCAVLYVDLDRFKHVNDAYGHGVGDDLLALVAGRLRSLARGDDAVFRLGGDEFVMVRSRVEHPADMRAAAAEIVEAMAAPFRAGGRTHEIGASVGVAFYPGDGRDAATLLQAADTALYKAKEMKGCYVLFDPAFDAEQRERRQLGDELRRAVAGQELSLAYEPQVSARGGAVVGFEASLRWRHPRLGEVPAHRFLPIAEETGSIVPLGAWALREACREAAGWPHPHAVSLGISPMQLRDPAFPTLLSEVLAKTGLDPRRLALGIAEPMLARDPARGLSALRRLKPTGVRLVLDRVGTGYSSVAALQGSPFEALKIDKAVVARLAREPAAGVIVETTIRLGHGLGLIVAADGVEREEQLASLAAEGCDFMQGPLIGPAGPPALALAGALRSLAGRPDPDALARRPVRLHLVS